MGTEVALKIVPREGNAGTRAEREASAAARLRHDRCPRAHALARDTGHVYIVYEHAPAGRCARRCAKVASTTRPRSKRPRRSSTAWPTRMRTASCTAT